MNPSANMHPWLTLSELLGAAPMPPELLIQTVRQLDRDHALVGLAQIAAILSGTEGGVLGAEARAWTHDQLVDYARRAGARPLERRVGEALAWPAARGRAIAHPLVIFFLQALVLAESPEGGRLTTKAELSFLMLVSNDHAPGWLASPTSMKRMESVAASVCYYGLFNRNDDPLRELARTAMLSEFPPQRGPIAKAWADLQREAFGVPFGEYVSQFLAPLFVFSKCWRGDDAPVLDRHLWFPATQIPEALRERWLGAVTMSLAEATEAARQSRQPNGLPRVPAAWFRKPFLAVTSERVIPLSPAIVSSQLSLAPWGALNQAAKARGLSNLQWNAAFGEVFERWCRALAAEAASFDGFRDRIVLSRDVGSEDEVEDVVFLRGTMVVLASVKAPVVAEKSLKDATSREGVIAWVDRFLFAPRTSSHRGGALRLLDRTISRLRSGAFEAQGVLRDATVLPMLITFDDIGESSILYTWIAKRCEEERLLSWRNGVRPVTLSNPADLEILLAAAAKTGSVCELLSEKVEAAWRDCTFQEFLLDKAAKTGTGARLPSLVRRFERACEELEALARGQET